MSVTLPTSTCKRCDHTWIRRRNTPPVQCPKCHSPYWRLPRREAAAKRIAPAPEPTIAPGDDRDQT